MANQDDDDDDDIDINPFTMLLLTDQPEPKPDNDDSSKPHSSIEDHSPNQQQQHYLRSIDSTVLIRQLRSQGLSFQLWPAATSLFSLLDNHRSHPSSSPLSPSLSSPHRLRILEIGSGTGLVGITAALTLSADVTLTDLPHVLPNLDFNALANREVLTHHGGSVDVAALSWGDVHQMEALIGREYDLVLGSDVVYHDHLYDPLLRTLGFFLLGRTVFVMAHLRRWKKEAVFFKRAKKMFDVEVIHRDGPCDGSRIYPTSIRATGFGLTSAVGSIGDMICPVVAVGLVTDCHQTAAILLFEAVMVVSGVFVMLLPLETNRQGPKLTDIVVVPE